MCVYDPDGPTDNGEGVSTVQFSGVQFKTNATIEGDLVLKFDNTDDQKAGEGCRY